MAQFLGEPASWDADITGCVVSRRAWTLPLVTASTKEDTRLCTPELSVNYIFHKSPVHTFHFWIVGFPLRTKTISLWYNRLYFYINVSSCCEIYCLSGPIRLLRFNFIFSVSQSIRVPVSLRTAHPHVLPYWAKALNGMSGNELFRLWDALRTGGHSLHQA